jgi:tetratricopeptide (TPR) repeat protein
LRSCKRAWRLCNNADQKTTPDAQAEGCTALIKSGAETPRILAIAYNNRGNTFAKKGDFEHAIEDYNLSLKANPKYAKALNNRGVAYQKKGEYDLAYRRPRRSDPA